jgi:hypothetical protein
LREPTPFKGDSVKEARDFIRALEIIFAISGDVYTTERERVLYGVMFLAGEAHEQWHLQHRVTELEGYTFEDFKTFVKDAVADPANRTVSVTLQHERMRQRENQTVRNFATELDSVEDQLPPYSEEQRVRHLLAKLQPTLRTEIVKYY